jgi:hypothetical protein
LKNVYSKNLKVKTRSKSMMTQLIQIPLHQIITRKKGR